MKYIFILISIAIFGISIYTRLANLDQIPLALSNDEISIAYDAHSLIHSGRDEHGVVLPLAFESLGTAKAPAYAYLLTPFLTFIPNNNSTARLPSVIAGLITLITIGLIAWKISRDIMVGLLASLILASTPWHITFSRMVLEANLALMFLSLGLLMALKKSSILSGLFFALSLYAYHSEWLLVPLLLLYLPQKNPKLIITFLFIVLPLAAANFLLPLSISRQSGTETLLHAMGFAPIKIILVFIRNYLQYLNPGYLFFQGLELFTYLHPYESGLFLWPLLLPFIVGFTHYKKYKLLIVWTLLSPIVSAFTPGTPNARRDLVSVLPYTIWIAIGIKYLYYRYKLLLFVTLGLTGFSLSIFNFIYFYHVPHSRAETYPPFREISEYLYAHKSSYKTALVDFRFGISGQFTGVPHLYLAYYSHLPPLSLQNKAILPDGSSVFYQYQVSRLDNFDPILGNYYVLPHSHQPSKEISPKLKLVHQFFDINNRISAEIWSPISE